MLIFSKVFDKFDIAHKTCLIFVWVQFHLKWAGHAVFVWHESTFAVHSENPLIMLMVFWSCNKKWRGQLKKPPKLRSSQKRRFYLDLVPVSDLTVVIQSIELYVTQIMTLCTTISSNYLISRFWLSQGDDDTQICQIFWVFVQYCYFSV